MNIYHGILDGITKEASITGKISKALTWGVPLGKYTGPSITGGLIGAGGYGRKMYANKLLTKAISGGKIDPIEKEIISRGIGVSPERAQRMLGTLGESGSKLQRALSSNILSNLSGGLLGRNVVRLAGLGAGATSAPIIAGAGAGLGRSMLNRAIGKRALLERLKTGGKLSLSEQEVFNRLRNIDRSMKINEMKQYIRPTVIGTGSGAGIYAAS